MHAIAARCEDYLEQQGCDFIAVEFGALQQLKQLYILSRRHIINVKDSHSTNQTVQPCH